MRPAPVLRQASQQFVKWRRNHRTGMRMAVNVSASQIYRTDLPRMVAGILTETGMRPEEVGGAKHRSQG